MTAGELIKELEKYPSNHTVQIWDKSGPSEDGRYCRGRAEVDTLVGGRTVPDDKPFVLIQYK